MRASLLFMLAVLLCSCKILNSAGGLGPENALGGNGRVNLAGANQLLPPEVESFSTSQALAASIGSAYWAAFRTRCPKDEGTNTATPSTTAASVVPESSDPVSAAIACVDAAATESGSDAKAAAVRNAVVGHLLIASDQRCNLYFAYLTNLSSGLKGTSTALGTLFGGVGTIINSLPATRIFSGLAGMSTGIGGNLDSALFHQAAISVIVPAIQKLRDGEREKIRTDFSKTYRELPLALAMDDVIHYHGLCDLNNGVATAAKAVAATPARKYTLADLVDNAHFVAPNGDLYIITQAAAKPATADTMITYEITLQNSTAKQTNRTARASEFLAKINPATGAEP